jgi:Leucine-rich repeat (LRR) protein
MDKQDVLKIIETARLKKAKILDLSNKDITILPSEIGNLPHLENLDLSYNYLKELPHEIGNLNNLKTLLLTKNEINDLPIEMGNLTKLTLVDISNNRITYIPSEIGHLVNLKSFDASYCKLKKLPIEFINLLSIKELFLEENNFEFPPQKIIKRGLYATMHFLITEKRKSEASKIVMQVYNMPQLLQKPFMQYVNYFNDMVSSVNENDLKIDINFIYQELNKDLEIEKNVESYLYDLLTFVKEKIVNLKDKSNGNEKINLIDIQVAHLKQQISSFNDSLDSKMNEINTIKVEMNEIYKSLTKKQKK